MEPAVRSARIEAAIITDRARKRAFGLPRLPVFPRLSNGVGHRNPAAGERNFWMQRREAKIGLRDGKRHRRPKERKNTAENPKETACLEAASGFAVSWFELA